MEQVFRGVLYCRFLFRCRPWRIVCLPIMISLFPGSRSRERDSHHGGWPGLAIAISLVALVVSGLSLFESQRYQAPLRPGEEVEVRQRMEEVAELLGGEHGVLPLDFAGNLTTDRILLDLARRRLEAAETAFPGNLQVAEGWSAYYLANGDYDRALAKLDEALPPEADQPSTLRNRGVLLNRMGRPEDAFRDFEKALGSDPRNPALHFFRALSLRDLGRDPEALAALEQAIALDPENAAAHSNRGLTLLGLGGRDAEALAAFEKAARLDPGLPDVHFSRGNILRAFGRDEEAVAAFDQAIRQYPGDGAAHSGRGESLLVLGRNDEALEAFVESARLDPKAPGTHNNRGLALLALGRDDEALEAFDEAIRLDPESAQGHLNRGRTLLALGRESEALAVFDEVIRLDRERVAPDNPSGENQAAGSAADPEFSATATANP